MRPGMLLTLVPTWVVLLTLTEPITAAVQAVNDRGNATATYPVLKIEGKPKTTSQEAWQSAEADARAALIEYRRNAGGMLERVPAQRLSRLLAQYWKPTERTEYFAEPVGRQMYIYEIRIPLSARLVQELEQIENEEGRRFLAQQRVVGVGKILAGLLLLLTAATCYFRLEESTKGYYTTLLRIGAVAVVGTGLAGLLLIA